MKDQELIQALRFCAERECDCCEREDDCPNPSITELADRLEELLRERAEMNLQIQKEICKRVEVEQENETLKAQSWVEYCQDMAEYSCPRIPRWVNVVERLPEKPDYYLCRVKSFVHLGRFYVNILEYDKDGFREGHIYTDNVTHWMPLPSTEGVE